MVERKANDSVSRRSVLKTAGGVLAGASMVGGRATASDHRDPKPIEIKDTYCHRGGNITLRNSSINPAGAVEVRIVAVNGSYRDSITLMKGAEATRGGIPDGTYKVKSFYDPNVESRVKNPEFIAEETVEIDCNLIDLVLEPGRAPLPGERVIFEVRHHHEEIIGYHWDCNGDGEEEGSTERPRFEYEYEEPGEYEATVTAVLEDETTVTATEVLTVKER